MWLSGALAVGLFLTDGVSPAAALGRSPAPPREESSASPRRNALPPRADDRPGRRNDIPRPGLPPRPPVESSGSGEASPRLGGSPGRGPALVVGDEPAGRPAAGAAEGRPWLVIEPAGYVGDVVDVSFSPDGRRVAAAGEKEVRIWDVATGDLLHTLRGDRHEYTAYGNCNAVAFSPDGKELLVGVHDDRAGSIRVYDAADPTEIQELFDGPGRPVRRLAFSRSGRYLAAAADNGRVSVWDWPARRKTAEIAPADPKQPVYDLVAFPTDAPVLLTVDPQGPRLFSASDGRPLYSPAAGWAEGADRLVPEAVFGWMEAVFGGKAEIPDGGEPKKAALRLERPLWALAVDGRRDGRVSYPVGVWRAGNSPAATYRGHRWTVLALAFSADGRLAASGDRFGEVHVWDAATGEGRHVFRSVGRKFYEAAFVPSDDASGAGPGFSIAFGKSAYGLPEWGLNRYGPAEFVFDLARRAIRPWDGTAGGDGPRDAGRLRTGDGVRSLTTERPDPNVQEFVAREGGRETGRYRLRSGAAASGLLLLGGPRLGVERPAVWSDDQGVVACWDTDSDRLRRAFIGHGGFVSAMDESPDGKLLVTGSTDRTIRLWRLGGYRPTGVPDFRYQDDVVVDVKPDSEAARAGVRVGDRVLSIDGKTIARLDEERIERTYAYRPGDRVPVVLDRGGRRLEVSLPFVEGEDFEDPLLSLFVTAENEWILWTPQGYYDASPGADRLIGWHVNRGPDRSASFYPVQQFRKKLYRPDVIDAILRTGDAAAALDQVAGRTGETEALDFRDAETLARFEPPAVRVTGPAEGASVTGESVRVVASIEARGDAPLAEARILVNGNPVKTVRVAGRAAEVSEDVPLLLGRNEISVVGYAGETPSEPRPVRVTRKLGTGGATAGSNAGTPKPAGTGRPGRPSTGPTRSLYLLAIGITRYEDKRLNSLRFPAEDAKAFAAVARRHAGGRLYDRVETKLVLDAEADREGILDGIDWLTRSAGQEDVAAIFVSAHGLHDEDGRTYYLAAHDTNPDKLRSTGVAWTELARALAQDFRGCNRVLFLDTCHSGGVTGQAGVFSPVQDDAAADVGVIVYASSTFRQKSLELEDHGAFTKGLLTILNDRGFDLLPRPGGDGLQTVDEVSTNLRDLVPRLTNQMQSPVVSIPTTVRNYELFEFGDP